MNVLQKKKRYIKAIISAVLSLAFVGYAYIKNVQTVNADVNNVITYNTYGSTERGKVTLVHNGTTYITDGWIRFNFNGQYNGIISINLAGASPMSNFAIAVDNCHIISTATNYIQIEFYGVNQCELHFNSTMATMGSFNINSVYFDSMHKVSDSDSAQLVNIVNRLTTLNSYNDQIETLLTTNNTLLQTIATNTAGGSGGGSSSTVNNIDINVDHIADELSLLKTSNDSILDELLGFFTDSLGQIITAENMIEAIENTTTAIMGIQTQLTSIGTTLNSINTTLNNINTAVQNIDNTIDTISWNVKQNQLYVTNDFTTFSTTSGSYSNSYYLSTQSFYVPDIIANNDIINIHTNTYLNPNGNIQLWYRNRTGTIDVNISNTIIYLNKNRFYIDLYFLIDSNDDTIQVNGTGYLYLKFDRTWNYYENASNQFLQYLPDDDIEYWDLLSYFDNYNMQRQILDAINSVSMQVTQQDITNTNNNVTNYNSTMNTIEGIETNIINNLNTDLSNLNLTSNYINPVDTNVRTAFDIVIQDFILDHNYIAGRFYLILICSLVLLMLGRW